MDINKWYQRLADNNDISYAGAKRLLKKNELEEFKWTVDQYIKTGEQNALNQRWMKELENASARYHISYLETMKIQMQQHAELLSTEFQGGITDFLHNAYGEQYYHTAFEIARGTGVGSNLTRLDTRRIDIVIKKPWAQDGASFSDRIWSNKQKLVRNLHTELTQNIIRGASPQKAISSLAKTMNVSRAQAGRLIMTESAAISSAAQKDCLKALGVEKYEILATLDNRTSDICQEMDGEVFDMKDYEVGVTAPPFRPWCRSITIPYFEDEFTAGEQRAARGDDGKTYYVPADMKYKEWEQRYVGSSISKSKPPDKTTFEYLIRNHKGANNTINERLIVNGAIASIPRKVQECIYQGTIIDVGQIGSSQYDYERDILYVAKGAEKEDVIHEIGHLVENKMLDKKKVHNLIDRIVGEVSVFDIASELYEDAAGNPREVFILRNDKFVSEYQGRIYVDNPTEVFNADGSIKKEALMEFISEPFRVYITDPELLKSKYKEFYDLIEEAVK